MKMVEMNRGPMVGGPFDGREGSVSIWPPDWPDYPRGIPAERTETRRVFSASFPEGALYRWHAGSGEWRYEGPPGPNAFGAFLKALGVRPAPPPGGGEPGGGEPGR